MRHSGTVCVKPKSPGGLAIDLDGTLLRSDHTVSGTVSGSLRAIADTGLPIVLVSGRPPRSVVSIAEHLNIAGTMVALNGALVVNTDGKIAHRQTIDQDAVSSFLDLIRDFDLLTAHYYREFDWLVRKSNASIINETAIIGFQPTITAKREAIAEIDKIMVVGPAEALGELSAEISHRRWPITVVRSKPTYLEITALGVTKAGGLKRVADIYGLSTRDFVAFGDGDNDVPLFAACGYGVAMGNASASLKAAADAIIGTNDEDAIASYIGDKLLRVDPRAEQGPRV